MQDDGGRLAVHTRPVLVALVARWGTPGTPALHRAEASLREAGLSVVVSKSNTWASCLTTAELKKI